MKMKNREEKEVVRANIEVSQESIVDIAVTAIEGGIGYWSNIENYNHCDPDNFGMLHPLEGEEDDFSSVKLTSKVIMKGIRQILMDDVDVHPNIRSSILLALVSEDIGEIDAWVADAIVQIGLFNNVHYG